jgi:uncharacterized protein YndB with AHSA1/START domain
MSHASDYLSATELRFERLLDAPVATVWRWLIEPELRARWFMGGSTDLKAGGALGLTMDHDRLSDESVETPERYRQFSGQSWSERILRVEPERLFAFEWNGGTDGQVTITLASEGKQTRLTLVHTGISNREGAVSFAGGWGAHLAVLELRLRHKPVANFWGLHAAAEANAKAELGM